jgi:glycosyltransferase involved in cell wall biosynthesis
MRPKVSVIVPIYNVEKYLDRCMRSVLNQTLKEIEIIMVDDGSPDKCPEMCEEYAKVDSRVKVIHKRNAGLGYARNSGLEVATGEYVAFVDSDDFVDKGMYESLYRTAREYSLDTCYCNFKYFVDKFNINSRVEVDRFKIFKGRNEVDLFFWDMVGPLPTFSKEVKYLMSVCKAIYSLDLINRFAIRFDSEREFASEDILFHALYLPKAEKVGFLPDHFYYYCENSSSITKTAYSEKNYECRIKGLFELQRRLKCFYSDQADMHFMRFMFLSLRGNINAEVNIKRQSFINVYKGIAKRCQDENYRFLLQTYPYKSLSLKKRVYFWAVRNKTVLLLYAIHKIDKLRGRK